MKSLDLNLNTFQYSELLLVLKTWFRRPIQSRERVMKHKQVRSSPYQWKKSLSRGATLGSSAVRYLPDNLCYEPLWSIISPYKEYPKLAEWQNSGSGQLIWLQDFSFVMLSLAVWFRSARANPGWVVRAWLQAHAFWSWQASRKQWRPGPIVICWANPSRKYLLYAAIFEITITGDYKLKFCRPVRILRPWYNPASFIPCGSHG